MIEKIGHYSIEAPGTIYDEEAMTALELSGRTAHKVNEVIDQSNKLDDDTRQWMHETTDTTIPNEVSAEVQNHIKNGDFDKQIDKSLGNLNERVNHLLGAVTEGGTSMDAEVIDIRLGINGHGYDNAGNAVRNQLRVYGKRIANQGMAPITFDEFIEGNVYSTTDGKMVSGPTWKCSTYLVPCGEHIFFRCSEKIVDDNLMLTCYDKDLNYLSAAYPEKNGVLHDMPKATPTGTAFVGLNVKLTNTAQQFTMHPLTVRDSILIQNPGDDSESDSYWYVRNATMAATGLCKATTTSNIDLMVFPAEGIKWVYTNYSAQNNCICLDGNRQVLASGGHRIPEKSTLGSFFEVPEGTVLIGINFIQTHQHDGQMGGYVCLSRGNRTPLDGKRVLTIGDSVAYLDNMNGYDDATRFQGWQKQLRSMGALVDNYSFSGAPYAEDAQKDNGDYVGDSLYTRVVTKAVDVTPYDIIILSGGLNDMLYHTDNEGPSMDYYHNIHTELPTTEMAGALMAIVKYIRDNNPTAEIYICQTTPSSNESRSLADAIHCDGILQDVARAMCVPFIPVGQYSNMTPSYNMDGNFTYDSTHPNKRGMERIGKIIARFICSVTE